MPSGSRKKLVDFHAILQIPKARTHPQFAHLPELESFARTDKERRLLEIYRAFRIASATFITPPRTPRSGFAPCGMQSPVPIMILNFSMTIRKSPAKRLLR